MFSASKSKGKSAELLVPSRYFAEGEKIGESVAARTHDQRRLNQTLFSSGWQEDPLATAQWVNFDTDPGPRQFLAGTGVRDKKVESGWDFAP